MTVDEILRAALELPAAEREDLATRLLDSLPEEQAQQLWATEIERREAEALAGESEHRDWRVALAEIEQRLQR